MNGTAKRGSLADVKAGVVIFMEFEADIVETTVGSWIEEEKAWTTDSSHLVREGTIFWLKQKPVEEAEYLGEKKDELLVLHCGGPFSSVRLSKIKKCRHSLQVPFAIGKEELTLSMSRHGWVLSVVSLGGVEKPISDVLCPSCSKIIYGERMYRTALAKMEAEVKRRMEIKMPELLRGSEKASDDEGGK